MRDFIRLMVLVVVCLSLSLSACGGDSSSPGETTGVATSATDGDSGNAELPATSSDIEGVIAEQLSHIKERRWRELYATFSTRFHGNCTYERFVEGQIEAVNYFGSDSTMRIVRVNDLQVQTDVASIQYTFSVEGGNGDEIARFESSLERFVQEDGEWKSEWNDDNPPSYCE